MSPPFILRHIHNFSTHSYVNYICLQIVHRYVYDAETKQAVSRDGSAESFPFHGVFLWDNFISEEEEEHLISSIDQNLWNESQSGRRKQVKEEKCSPSIHLCCQEHGDNLVY